MMSVSVTFVGSQHHKHDLKNKIRTFKTDVLRAVVEIGASFLSFKCQ